MKAPEAPYCVATVIRDIDPEDIQTVTLGTFDEVVAHLRETYSWFANAIADARAAEDHDSIAAPAGGFGVELQNRWQHKVEVGVGRDIWLLIPLKPDSAYFVSDAPALDGTLVFYLDGWHHTELESRSLVSKDHCLKVLRWWLDTGELNPMSKGS